VNLAALDRIRNSPYFPFLIALLGLLVFVAGSLNLLFFLFVVITLAGLMIGLVRINPGYTDYNKGLLWRTIIFVGGMALIVQCRYVSAPQHIFTNAEHHVLEHLGFRFSNWLTLVDERDPKTALWDEQKGSLRVVWPEEGQAFMLRGHNYSEPLYTQTNPDLYELQGSPIPQPIRRTLTVGMDSVTLSLNLSFSAEQKTTFSVSQNGRNYGPFTVPLPMPLTKGYSLGGMLSKAQADAPGMGELIANLDSVYLLRRFIETEPTSARDQVVLFPSRQFLESGSRVSIDGQAVTLPRSLDFNQPIAPNQVFFLGLWNDTGKRYRLRRPASGGSELLVSFPQKRYLKNLDEVKRESLFLTSSSAEITGSEQMGGYYFPLFGQSDNQNHIAANLCYHTGPTQERIAARVIDQYDGSERAIQNVGAGDTIRLQTVGMNRGQSSTQWLFRLRNLKADNPLQFWHMLLLTLLIVAGIGGCIWLTPDYRQTKLEFIAYLSLLSLMTVRSILLWRASTFLPVEEITPNVFRTLTELGFRGFWIGGVACLLILLGLMGWKVWENRRINNPAPIPSASGTFSPWMLVWFALYGLALGVKVGGLERMGAIFMPLAVYFILSYLFMKRLSQTGGGLDDPTYQLLNRLNWLCCLGYLALSDAGFSVIFLLGSLFYWLIYQLTFPIEDRTLHERIVWGIVITILIALFLWGLPRIMSVAFRHTHLFLSGLAVLIIGWGVWSLRQQGALVLFGVARPRWVQLGAGLLVACLLFAAEGPISRKVEGKNYGMYRAEILFKQPDDIIQSEEFRFNMGNDSKLLQAAQNQWFINYFYRKGNPNPLHYFRVLPSFQKGSPYLTQICDLVTVRYVIGEHSQFVITFLISLLSLLVIACSSNDTPFNQFAMLRVRLMCLLLAVAFFVWMAATNKIVFLGQDFPLLSLNSTLTLLTTFSILFFGIILGDLAKRPQPSFAFNEQGHAQSANYLRLLLVGAIFVLPVIIPNNISEERFDLSATVNKLQTFFDRVNGAFLRFQQEETPRANEPLNEVLTRFTNSGYAPDSVQTVQSDSAKGRFVWSAYRAYLRKLRAEGNNPAHLVHVRRRKDDFYEFRVNRLFYNVSSPDVMLNAWQGNLVADSPSQTIQFVNQRNNRSQSINAQQPNSTLADSIRRLIDRDPYHNIRLTSLPARWSADSMPLVLVSSSSGEQEGNRASFRIKSGPDIFDDARTRFAIRLRPNDVLELIPHHANTGHNTGVALQYRHQSRQYLAKNVWLNGHRQFFYPLGSKFLWPYHFANLVKTKFDSEDVDRHRDVHLSLDPQLTEQIHNLASQYFRATKWDAKTERARAFNLVVLGSDGKLRGLCDYRKGAPVQIDPNRMEAYKDLLTNLYLDVDIEQERLLFGNRCLMRMDNGPASTFKPILYSAITSQYRFGWENLGFGGLMQHPDLTEPSSDNSTRIKRFGGRPIRFIVDNNTNIAPHNADAYISQSTNTYNSMMVYLGSLTRGELHTETQRIRQTGNGTFLRRGVSDNPRENFPILTLSGMPYRIGQMPDTWTNASSVLGTGLWHNFHLPVTTEQLRDQGLSWLNPALALDSTLFNTSQSSFKLWSSPEASHLYLIDRINDHNAIVQCATGSDPITTTPYKMAEMAASLFSFNKQFRSSVLANNYLTRKPFSTDPSWGQQTALAQFYGNVLFRAMNQTVSQGTARVLLADLRQYGPYHLYAKTGTNSGDRDNGRRDKHLMLIISQQPLHEGNLSPQTLRDNRFMVLYFSFYKQSVGSEWDSEVAPTLRRMIQTVIRSDSFQALMNTPTTPH
jgi:hypothetical protein